MKTRFVFNPHSGHNRRRPGLARTIRDFIATRSLDADFAMTEGPGHATELARHAVQAGCSRVVAVGGDGTMNEVAQALIGAPAALALVPCGSGNGLALHLGLPTSPLTALHLVAGGGTRTAALDTGLVNGFPFFNAMGLGLDADVSRRFNRLSHRGLPAYARTALAALRELRHERCTIVTADESKTLEVLLIAVANSDQYGNNARIAPGARVDDGMLDLVAVKPVGLLGAANLAARLFLGNFDRSPHVHRMRGAHFTIERSAPGIIHTDGETHATGARLEVSIRPRSLRVVVPAVTHAVAFTDDNAPAGFALQLP
ncbi:MAG TPA: diacylglycerol kinase family protein [Opitutaceae bacterium]|nr:diacylglycerol kinase family protein [Opitutaceae bacterium]